MTQGEKEWRREGEEGEVLRLSQKKRNGEIGEEGEK